MTRSPHRRHDEPRLYKYVTAPTLLRILRGRTLRWSSPLVFNDPFDVARDFVLPFRDRELQDEVIARFRAYLEGEAVPGTPAGHLVLAVLHTSAKQFPLDTLLADLRNSLDAMLVPLHLARAELREAWTERIPRMRILCFSTDPFSPAMWAHYADDFAGAVLGFETSDETDSSWLLARPVRYSPTPPSLPSVGRWARALLGEEGIDWDEYLREYYFVKTPDWSYEREYRVWSDAPSDDVGHVTDKVFHEMDLREVILGPQIAPHVSSTVRTIVAREYPNTVVWEAMLDRASRVMRVVKTDRPTDRPR